MKRVSDMQHPTIIQGGMGIGVSGWRLARAVSQEKCLGVVSGVALAEVQIRRLQDGDKGGHIRRALAKFPFPHIAENIFREHFLPQGRQAGQRYHVTPMYTMQPTQRLNDLTVAANFVEVFLAKEGHSGLIGINLLEKMQLRNLPSIYGAMLAGVDYVLMGAGVPREIPGALDRLASGQEASISLQVGGAEPSSAHLLRFDPRTLGDASSAPVKRPHFLTIVSTATLAQALVRRSNGRVDGFVIENFSAGGHNAPPRRRAASFDTHESRSAERDEPDLDAIRSLERPFWLAGSYGHPDKLVSALEAGATGIQLGTAFAFCEESGLAQEVKEAVLRRVLAGEAHVTTNPRGSPTGYPFKIVQLDGSVSERDVYLARKRICDVGGLRLMFARPDGTLVYRCPAEPVEAFVEKGGDATETEGRLCLCNGLLASIGLGQIQKSGDMEPPLVTAGSDLPSLKRFITEDRLCYSARDVIAYVTQRVE